MFAVFLHYYNYTADQVLAEYAKRFFALCAQMYRNKAIQSLTEINNVGAGLNGKEASGYVNELRKQAEGNDKLIQEAKTIREVRR